MISIVVRAPAGERRSMITWPAEVSAPLVKYASPRIQSVVPFASTSPAEARSSARAGWVKPSVRGGVSLPGAGAQPVTVRRGVARPAGVLAIPADGAGAPKPARRAAGTIARSGRAEAEVEATPSWRSRSSIRSRMAERGAGAAGAAEAGPASNAKSGDGAAPERARGRVMGGDDRARNRERRNATNVAVPTDG